MGGLHQLRTMQKPQNWLVAKINAAAVSAIQKFVPYSTGSMALYSEQPAPPYQRRFNPRWVYKIRENHALINNAIEEKVSQTFRRGFDSWEKQYEAKCAKCKEEFDDQTPFRKQYGEGVIPEDTEIDFDSKRVCPECDQKARMLTPDQDVKDEAEEYFNLANARDKGADHLQPVPEAGVGQQFISVCKEVGWDIQSFDDGWMLFERQYDLDPDGRIIDWDLKGVHRGPPELLRFSVNEAGRIGSEYWICPKCRAMDDHYQPETEPQPCSGCEGKTYEVFAYSTKSPQGEEPENFYIRGEFAQASEFSPTKYYGYSPIVTLFDEARAIEKMDEWYREAYEQRRAPRGALVVRSSNADATRKWNRGQMEKLNDDSNHIPTLMDDTEGGGSDPIKFEQLLDSPAEMQQMEMREWIKDRISAKFGVTEIMMSGSPENSGLSQSMEVQVSNRAADRLRRIYNEIFLPAFIGQIGAEGWTREVAEVEEEDELAEAEKHQRELQIAEQAARLGLEVEWKEDGTANVKPGDVQPPSEQEEQGMGEMGGMGEPGGDTQPADDMFGEGEGQNQLDGVNSEGGAPSQDSRPAEGESAFGRMAEKFREKDEIEVYNDDVGVWEKAEIMNDLGEVVHCRTKKTETDFYVDNDGRMMAV